MVVLETLSTFNTSSTPPSTLSPLYSDRPGPSLEHKSSSLNTMLPPTPLHSSLAPEQPNPPPTSTLTASSPRHPLSHTIAHPPIHRSDSLPNGYGARPAFVRTLTTPALAAMSPLGSGGEFKLRSPVGSMKVGGGEGEDDRDDLTTKGKKRKRLAKACSACHKNKRRCDGFAPCSNCEFSSRACLYLNSAGEVIPPPRTREGTARKESIAGTPATNTLQISAAISSGTSGGGGRIGAGMDQNDGSNGSASGSPEKRQSSNEGPGGKNGQSGIGKDDPEQGEDKTSFGDPLEAVDRDSALSAELIDLFFNRIHPYGSMLHGPTFHYRLFVGRTSPLLLDAMYALSAHLSTNPTLLDTLSPSIPLWARGSVFADRASRTAKHLIDLRSTWSEEEKRLDRGTWEETEFVQAIYLLSIYYTSARQPTLGFFFLDAAIDILRPTSMASLPRPSSTAGLSQIEYLTLGECRNRTFWMLVLQDLCAAANGRPRRLMDHEVYNIPLPGDEALWERWGGGGTLGRDGVKRDGLAVGTGNWPGAEGQVGELGHVLRVLVVFSDIMTVANSGIQGPEARGSPGAHEHALKTWAHALPSSMRFDENTLSTAVARLDSTRHTVSRSGWLFAYMHAMAECGMFYLQAALATIGADYTAQRQSQAVDNIAVILEAIGARGRESPLMIFPLLVVSNWHDHLRSTPAPPTAQQHLLDERIPLWWADASRDWGFERNAPPEIQYSRSHLQPPQHHQYPQHHTQGERSLHPTHPPPSSTLSTHSSLSHHRHSHSHSQSYSKSHGSRGVLGSATSLASPLPPVSSITLNPPTSGLGLYGTSPPTVLAQPPSASFSRSSESASTAFSPHTAMASGSGMGSVMSHRYSQPALPPLRQRANTLASTSLSSRQRRSPSPGFSAHLSLSSTSSTSGGSLVTPGARSVRGGRRPLPSLSGISGLPSSNASGAGLGGGSVDKLEIKLPPLPPMDPSPRYEGVFKFPSFWNNNNTGAGGVGGGSGSNGGSGTGTPTGLNPLSGVENGKTTKFGSPSPRFNPYSASGRLSISGTSTVSASGGGNASRGGGAFGGEGRSGVSPNKRFSGGEEKYDSRPVSPRSIPRSIQDRPERPERQEDGLDGRESKKRKENEGYSGVGASEGSKSGANGPVGIEALISAAEEKSKERESILGVVVSV